MSNKHEPAFPSVEYDFAGNVESYPKGISKREFFTALAMQGLCSSLKIYGSTELPEDMAKLAVSIADHTLAQLDK